MPRPTDPSPDAAVAGAGEPCDERAGIAELREQVSLFEQVPDLGSWSWDARTDSLRVSRRFTRLLALPDDATITLEQGLAAMPAEDAERVRAVTAQMLGGSLESCRVDYHLKSADGVLRAFECHVSAVRDGAGTLVKVLGATRDVTERRDAQATAALQADLLDEVDAAVLLMDLERRILGWSAGAQRLYGWSAAEAVGHTGPELLMAGEQTSDAVDRELLFREGRWEGEMLHARRDGSLLPVHARLRVTRDERGEPERLVAIVIDVSERKAQQRELEAARDYLRAVTDAMDESMYTLDVEGRLQYVNPAAQRLLGWSAEELVGRTMHELTHCRHPDGSPRPEHECPIFEARAQGRVVEVADDIFIRRDGSTLPVSYAALPFSTDEGVEGCVVIFEDITERKAEERRVALDREKLGWAVRLRDALARDRFELYSQPIVSCESGEVVQQELLLRLNDPELGVVAPGAFLPVAEELGLIGEIDRWVIRRAAEIAAEHGSVELNLSACSVADRQLVDHIRLAIEHAGVDPARLLFEITETAVISDEAAAGELVERLHSLGCQVALDDFGTGYGSFTYLKHLPIDVLKIDREFVGDLVEESASRSVVEAVVSLARAFDLKTVGEGVESRETFELLASLGVDRAQGFHLGRPRPLARREPPPTAAPVRAEPRGRERLQAAHLRGRTLAARTAAEAAHRQVAALRARPGRAGTRRPPP